MTSQRLSRLARRIGVRGSLCGALAASAILVVPTWSVAAALSGGQAAPRDGVITFEGSDGLYVMSASGREPSKIPGTMVGDGDPVWSPDGREIAFDRGGDDRDVYVMNADGSNQVQLTRAPDDDAYPHWAPHGRALTFLSLRDGRSAVYAMDVARDQARRLAHDGVSSDWALDRRILFTGSNGYLMSVSPYGARRRFERAASFDIQFLDVRISDDDSMIVFTSSGADGPRRGLYTARRDGSPKRILRSTLEMYDPAWSPDGQWISFSGGPSLDRLSVYIVRADGNGLTRLAALARKRFACCSDWSDTAKIP